MAKIIAERTKADYGFTAIDEKGNTIQIDIPVDQGGEGKGFRPMQTVLAALSGCSGVDIVSILKKQRQEIAKMNIEIRGERETGKEPSLWKTIDLEVNLEGQVDPPKAYRAVELSINKYCSVAETLRRAGANITWSVTVNGEKVNIKESSRQ